MKRKSIMALCMAFAISLTTLIGCKKDNDTKQPVESSQPSQNGETKSEDKPLVSPENPITITVFIGDSTIPAATPDNKIYKKIKEELGITFEIELLAGDINQKLGVMIAGDDLPDLVTYNSKFQDANTLIPLEDLIQKYAPDIYSHYEPHWEKMKDQNDQHIYCMPNWGVYHGKYTANYYGGPAFWIQKDVLAQAGYPKVTTLDQYFDLIEDYMKKNPTIDGQPTIGFETLAVAGSSFVLENAPAQLAGSPNDGGVIVKDGVAELYADKEISKTYFKKLNEMYNKGVLDREAITQNKDQYLQKIASGRVLGMYDQGWHFQSAEETLLKDKRYERTYAPLALTYEGIKPYYRDRSVVNLGNGFAITKNCEEPERVIYALNLLMSEKWQKLLNWGVEGEDYSIDAATGQPVWSDEQEVNNNDNAYKAANRAAAIYSYMPKIEGQYSDGNATAINDNPIQFEKSLNEYDRNFFKQYGVVSRAGMMGDAPENPVHYPAWNINIPANSPASIANTQLEDARLKWLPRVIASNTSDFEAQWNAFVEEFNNCNPKAYLDAINEGIQYRIKNWTPTTNNSK
ncbi:sugar ABC transporter substrate-binding protein [Clostridium thermarum]|uniref:sugar ABC transporter substrate-binding protein n=1 Tax=Clostridium thermarum TaxID=1716543 RepID=UPI0013D5C26A|nr:sugar ABC transporter substrate-binding protein [Clostridium thermarum]